MKIKALIATFIISFTVQPETLAQASAAPAARSGADQILKQKASDRSFSRQQAARVAKREIRRIEGISSRGMRVTGIQREDDFGARWEVEVTLRNRTEYDVYISRVGRVVNVIRQRPSARTVVRPAGPAVSLRDARSSAVAHVEKMTGQTARVTGSRRENDHGARWEVEVTLIGGFEYDVYVGRNGKVMRVEEKGFDRDDKPPANGSASTGRDQAAAIALAHIRRMTGQSNARVTGVVREDDFGAWWEVEVTLPSGLEYDVYVGQNGQVIRAVHSN